MLSRLMKYEMRSQSRLLLPLHALLLLASILGRFFITGKVYERVPTVVFIILITLYLFSLVGISTGTQLFISVRFYQSLFSDEGYLAFTLPVTPGQHLLARTLVGGLWALIDTVIIFASFIILVMVPEVSAHWPELSEALTKELGMDSNAFFILMFLLNCISASTGIILIYFCIAVGQLFSKHRILMALLTYLGLTALVSVIVLLTSVLSGTLPNTIGFGSETTRFFTESYSQTEYFLSITKNSLILAIVQAVIAYVITHYILSKKINLN